MRFTTLLTIVAALGSAMPASGQGARQRLERPALPQARSAGPSPTSNLNALRTRHRARFMGGRPTASGELNVAITDRDLQGLTPAQQRERLQALPAVNDPSVRRVRTLVEVRRPTRVSLFRNETLELGTTTVPARGRDLTVTTTVEAANLRIGRASGPRPPRQRQTASLFLSPDATNSPTPTLPRTQR